MNEVRAQLDDAALRIRGVLRHLPTKHDQMSHGRGGHAKALIAALEKLIPDDQPEGALTFDDGRYFDFASTHGRPPGVFGWDVGDADGEVVQFDLDEDEVRNLTSAMSVTLLRDTSPPPDPDDRQAVLLSALLQAGQHGAVAFGENDQAEGSGRYFDWSGRGDDGAYELEVGVDGDAVQMKLTPDEMAQLHAQLVKWLMRDAERGRTVADDPIIRAVYLSWRTEPVAGALSRSLVTRMESERA